MSFDCSRFSFNVWNDFLGVVMQQGRVQLDADWNEWVAQMIRRVQAGTFDTFEQPVVPRTTPDGFRIALASGALKIGVGRLYVDGVVAENHGGGALQWDPHLAEQVGTEPLDYLMQPYYPSPPALPAGGPHLVYLDVWQREVTYLQQPELIEKAIGIDTTARLQTVWQVKVLPNIGTAQCGTPDQDVPGWADATRPSAGRLSTATETVLTDPDPCRVPPGGGYRGLENQLYRVEIHDGGQPGTASFKWSRDNGTVQTAVRNLNPARDQLIVDRVGRDAVLRFNDGDWVEITDDLRELSGMAGIVRRIKLGGGVDDATRTIMLTEPLPAGVFPTSGSEHETDPARHTRIRRWDQSGQVLRADGTVFLDLDLAGATGLIPVPPAGTRLLLEDGIVVQFDLASGGGAFHTGDYWTFAARAADATIETLNQAPPLGIHHHYARLAVVTLPGTVDDCRVFWPPATVAGEDCACDVCVTPEGHAAGTATIQQAITQLTQTGGVICLAAGVYRLKEPLRIDNAGALTLRGKGWRTLLAPESTGTAIQIDSSMSVSLEDFAVAGAAGSANDVASGLIHVHDALDLTLQRLYLLALPGSTAPAPAPTSAWLPQASRWSTAVKLDGYLLGARMRECAVMAEIGIAGAANSDEWLLSANLVIEDNLLLCNQAGVALDKWCVHAGDTCLARNVVMAFQRVGLGAVGAVLPGGACRIDANTLYGVYGQADGVIAGTDNLHITDNEISVTASNNNVTPTAAPLLLGNGMVLAPGLDPKGIGHLWVTGNHLSGFPQAAIAVQTPLGSALIKQNILERSRSGMTFTGAASSEYLAIDNNQLIGIAAGWNPAEPVVGIEVMAVRQLDITSNIVSHFAEDALQASDRAAIRAVACTEIRIAGNRLSEIGPVHDHAGYTAGIEIQLPYTCAAVSDNMLSRSSADTLDPAAWHAIRIAQPAEQGGFSAAGAFTLLGDGVYLLTATRLWTMALLQPESVAVRGNHASARMVMQPMILVAGAASCQCLDNHFAGTAAANAIGRGRLVELSGNTVIVSNNRVRWIDSEQDVLDISGFKAITVLGNITMGRITVEANPLPGPWQPLNVIAS